MVGAGADTMTVRAPRPSAGATCERQERTGMTDTQTSLINRPAWVELSSTDADGSREFYKRLFG